MMQARRKSKYDQHGNIRQQKLDVRLFRFQKQVFFDDEHIKYRIVTKGRRVGFTYGAVYYYLKKMVLSLRRGQKPIRLLWGDVNYNNINKYMEDFFVRMIINHFGLPHSYWHVNMSRKELRIGPSVADFRSATRPQTWEGFGYEHVFLNEAGIILNDSEGARYLYENSIRPMMLDYPDSRLIAGGVPKIRGGKFYELFLKASDPKEKLYKAYNFSTFHNPNLQHEDIREYESSIDDITAQQEIYGNFVDRVGNPFVYAFDPKRHVGRVEDDGASPVILSFDFNVEPMTCLVFLEEDSGIKVLREYRLMDSHVADLCQRIAHDFGDESPSGNRISFVTGDASGYARSAIVSGNINAYILIMQLLNLDVSQIKTPRSNPSIINSRILTNSLFARHPDLVIDEGCRFLIEDLRFVEVDGAGGIDKGADKHKTHLLDCLRYYFYSFHHSFIRELD